jgi:hypothetical protein
MNKIGEEQMGFCKGMPLSKKHREFDIETHLAFVGYRTFDKVNKNKLIEIYAESDIPN